MSWDTRALENALLTGKWSEDVEGPAHAVDLAKKVVDCEFHHVLTSSHVRDLFTIHRQSAQDILDRPLQDCLTLLSSEHEATQEQELLQIIIAVACLHTFLQVNWTGPDLDIKYAEVLALPQELTSSITEDVLHRKSIVELAWGGEPAYHLAQLPLLLQLAKILLELPYRHIRTAPWWRLRAWSIHEHILDEPAAVPDDLFPSLKPVHESLSAHPDLAGRLLLEEGLLQHTFGHDRTAAELFVQAARATQLRYELTGALGKRTKFQQTDITQLVLLAESRKRDDDTNEQTNGKVKGIGEEESNTIAMPDSLALNDDTLLEQTQFTSSSPAAESLLKHLDPSSQPALHPIDQCIFLAMCLNVRNTSPSHGLTTEQMSPYVARVISHPRNWSIHTMALLLRSRLEAHRTRTVERSTFQLQALVDQMPTADSTPSERLLYLHSIPMPNKWELQKELALRFMSLGVVKSAIEIFERLEMWEEVVKCWQSMEQREKGVAIVRDLLEGRKAEADIVIARGKSAPDSRKHRLDTAREAKLWCLLGDLEPDKALEHYSRGWEISKQTSGRAMRSMGGYYFSRADYQNTTICLRRAVSINPLLTRSWFILGCAYVRLEQWDGAKEAFTRCVSIDEEDAESWSNLASVYLRMGEAGKKIEESKEDDELEEKTKELTVSEDKTGSIPFSNRTLAFRALKHGLKHSYDNWRMWSNYMIVAMDVGELSEACRALGRVVEERSAKDGAAAVDEDVLERLVDAVTRAPRDEPSEPQRPARNPNEGYGLLRQVTDVFERVILPRVSSPRIFRARGRLLTWQGRWEEALKAYLDAYRSSTAGTIEKGETEVERFREGVCDVEDVVDVLRNFGPRVEGSKWKLQAKSILRTFMGRTRDFEDEPEWSRLTELQEELKQEE